MPPVARLAAIPRHIVGDAVEEFTHPVRVFEREPGRGAAVAVLGVAHQNADAVGFHGVESVLVGQVVADVDRQHLLGDFI